jgi:hypothetical protein
MKSLLLVLALVQYVDPPAKPYAYIEMETRADCLPCLRWKYSEKSKLEQAGWKVIEKQTSGEAPKFRVVIGERRITHVGYLTMNKLREIVKGE